MKKILIALPLAAVIFALAACDDGSVKSTKALTKTSATTTGARPNPALNKVLLLGQTSTDLTDVVNYLTPFGFAQLGTADNTVTTPTLAELQAYDVVLLWTNSTPANPIILGDNLAAFVDGGGGLVLASYSDTLTWGPQGAIMTGYSPYNFDGTNPNSVQTLGPIYLPNHYIMQGVTTLSASARDTPTLAPGGTKIADWANGDSLVAVNSTGKVVGLGFLPWLNLTTGDYARLVANTLAWVGKR